MAIYSGKKKCWRQKEPRVVNRNEPSVGTGRSRQSNMLQLGFLCLIGTSWWSQWKQDDQQVGCSQVYLRVMHLWRSELEFTQLSHVTVGSGKWTSVQIVSWAVTRLEQLQYWADSTSVWAPYFRPVGTHQLASKNFPGNWFPCLSSMFTPYKLCPGAPSEKL